MISEPWLPPTLPKLLSIANRSAKTDPFFFHDFGIEGTLENSCKDLPVVLQVMDKMSEFPKTIGDNPKDTGHKQNDLSGMLKEHTNPSPSKSGPSEHRVFRPALALGPSPGAYMLLVSGSQLPPDGIHGRDLGRR